MLNFSRLPFGWLLFCSSRLWLLRRRLGLLFAEHVLRNSIVKQLQVIYHVSHLEVTLIHCLITQPLDAILEDFPDCNCQLRPLITQMRSIFASRVILDVDHLQCKPVCARVRHHVVVSVYQLLYLTHIWHMLVRVFGLLRSFRLLTHLFDAFSNGLDCLVNFLFDLVKSTELPLNLLT